MNAPEVIPQSPSIRARVRRRAEPDGAVLDTFLAAIVAWEIHRLSSGSIELEPIVWRRNAAEVCAPTDEHYYEVIPDDDYSMEF